MLTKEIIEEQLQKNPQDAELWYQLGCSITVGANRAETRAEYHEKLKRLKKAIELNPLHKDATYELAKLQEWEGNYTIAKMFYEKVKKLSPDIKGLDEAVKRCLEKNTLPFRNGLQYYKERLAANPNDPKALEQLGSIYQKLGENDKSLEYLEKARAINPEHDELNYFLALTYRNLKRYDDAISCYKKEIEKTQEKSDISNWLEDIGSCYYEMKNYPQAREYYLKAIDTYTDGKRQSSHWLYMTAMTYYSEQKYEDAIIYFKTSMETEPDKIVSDTIYAAIGESYYHLGELQEAKLWYSKAVAVQKDSDNAFFGLGLIEQTMGDNSLAETAYKMALNCNAFNHNARVNLGAMYQLRGEYLTAIELYKKCLEMDESFLPAYRNLAIAYLAMSDYEKSEFYLAQFKNHGGNLDELKKLNKS